MMGAYARARRGVVLLLCAFGLICAVVFALYNLPVAATGYAAVLCAALGVVVGTLDYYRFQQRRRALQVLRSSAAVSLEGLPEAGPGLDADYEALLHTLFEALKSAEQRYEAARVDMLDYYTLWVHQIKTPIAALQLLLPAGEQALGAELTKIEGYVEMVLSYMRLESDTTDFVIRCYPLEPIVKRAVRKVAKLFILKKIQLSLAPIDLTVLTDEKWLSFAIEQLLSNAIKYTNGGAVSIFMEGSSLVIADTGIGIRPEDLPRVFERGYTGLSGRVSSQSTGIGLYLSRRILTQLRHGIAIASELGQGTRVTIDLATEDLDLE